MVDAMTFADTAGLRAWLAENAETADEVWVAFEGVAPGRPGPRLADAAREAAAAGWVEVERAGLDGARYAVRFAPGEVQATPESTPRPRSWAGYKASAEDPALGAEYESELMANDAAWAFFQEQRPAYRRAAIWWVVGAAHEETRRRRLAQLVETSARGERLPQVTRNL